ncbi:hypothetical protein H1Q59_07770 [Holosporaceae bacterium 'Namur']|nr:hypothetical protein [Holosporaceae bacterium 'Namur']
MQNKIFENLTTTETKLYYEHILRVSFDLALKFNSKETALFIMEKGVKPFTRLRAFLDLALEYNKKEKVISLLEEGIKPFYKKGDHYSYLYKLNLYNALTAINNLPVCLEYFSKAPLPNEMLREIASYIKPISKENKALIEPLRQEIYEARVKTCKKAIPLLFGTAVALGMGISFLPLEATMLCGVAGMMYFTYNTKFEKVGMQLTIPLIFIIIESKVSDISSEADHIPHLGEILLYGITGSILLLPHIITQAVEKVTSIKPINYPVSALIPPMIPNLINISMCGNYYPKLGFGFNCMNLNQHLQSIGSSIILSSLSLTCGLLFYNYGKPVINNIATSTEEDRKIFADVSYKTCISLKNYAMKKVTKFADRVSKSLENLAEGVSDLQSSGIMR